MIKKCPQKNRYVSIGFLVLLVTTLALSAYGPGQLFGPTPTLTPTLTSTPTVTPSATPTATPTPGLGVPVAGKKYTLVLLGASQAFVLSSNAIFNATTYRPKAGYTFLVANATISKLDSADEISIASNQVAIIGEDGAIITADGLGQYGQGGSASEFNYCVGCVSTISGTFDEITLSFVFVLESEAINQSFKFQFQDVPLIPFRANRN